MTNIDWKDLDKIAVTEYPDQLPILPLRGVVVYPQTAVPLTVGQPRSIRLIEDVQAGAQFVGLVASRDPSLENPEPADLYTTGTIATVHRLFRAPDGTIRLLVQGIDRIRIKEFVETKPYIRATFTRSPETVEDDIEIEALVRNAREQFEYIAGLTGSIPEEIVSSILGLDDPLATMYSIANFQRLSLEDSQGLLELDSTVEKFKKLIGLLVHETEILEIGQKIQDQARSEIDKVQREYFLREQLKAIQRELGDMDREIAEADEFRTKIAGAKMSPEAEKQALYELDRLSRLPTGAAEYGVIRTYLDWLTGLPWSTLTEDNLDIKNARGVLDADHYALEDVKERILEYLAVRKLRRERREELEAEGSEDYIRRAREGVILCFVGPPGVGKTSLGRSIARALGRQFIRTSLGGIRDEAEIRGHRRTYIGALPGRVLQALRRVESRNPVFMLDEIDKVSSDYRGDPASALLEVLDPEQNVEFRDHYLEVGFDLSQVMFITTANLLDLIPAPLLDRMEVIRISGYTEREKTAIAQGYLIPRQLRENGLLKGEVTFSDASLQTIIRSYTREAGVRNLEREIGAVCRKVVTKIAERDLTEIAISNGQVREYLGRPRFHGTEEIMSRTTIPGIATGLAWTPTGGDVLFVEATHMPGTNQFQLTGSLGEVMQESARAGLSFVRSRVKKLGLDENFFEKRDIHIHVPSGGQPKDGPSAGITIVTALISLISDKAVRGDLAMTGEITLRGQVLPVGGIKEKVLAAHRSGLRMVILPKDNEVDLDELPKEIRDSIEFIFADQFDDLLPVIFAEPKKKPRRKK
jgi:ATP-dependent Lon protease